MLRLILNGASYERILKMLGWYNLEDEGEKGNKKKAHRCQN
jgi:hypothetical protein